MKSAELATGMVKILSAHVSYFRGGVTTRVLESVSLEVQPGEFLAILGPSGCGKSTLLGAIAGFNRLTQGDIFVDSRPVQKPDADRGIVFQDHNLFPWKTVIANVEFGLKMRHVPETERRHLAIEMLTRVGLAEFARHYPDQLSGGMQQRVNLARVLVNRPEVLLMDEPFGALDAQTRLQMQELLLNLWAEYGMTVLFVTHDVDEAILLSDRVLIMSKRPGRIRAEIPVTLGRPRSVDLLTGGDFTDIKRECMQFLRSERAGFLQSSTKDAEEQIFRRQSAATQYHY
jgi:NitT/TauT family transport system ATP-binding protein